MNRTYFFKRGHLLFAALLAIALGALTFACGSNDDAPGACEGAACTEGGTPESSTSDGPGADTSIVDGGTNADADADSSIPISCGDGGEPGTLDPTFGDGGLVRLDYNAGEAHGVAVQADGKIVVVGATQAGFAVVRLLTSGALDTTFGTNGLVTTVIGTTGTYQAVAIQADGKILATGGAEFQVGNRSYDFAVVRYYADGGLDPSFGTGGVATTDFGAANFQDDYAQSIAVLPDGRILVGGNSEANSVTSTGNFVLARYNSDGSPDTTFGGAGKVIIDMRGTVDSPGVTALLPTGKSVIAGGSGETTSITTRSEMSAAYVNSSGSPDPSFADAGKFISNWSGSNAFAIAVDGAGKILLAGSNGADFALLRLTTTGALDPTFGDAGTVTTDFSGGDIASAIIVQEDGRLVVAGQSDQGAAETATAISIARYSSNGALDPSFGVAGKTITVPPANAYYGASSATIKGCGLLVVGQWAYGPSAVMQNAMGIARYRR